MYLAEGRGGQATHARSGGLGKESVSLPATPAPPLPPHCCCRRRRRRRCCSSVACGLRLRDRPAARAGELRRRRRRAVRMETSSALARNLASRASCRCAAASASTSSLRCRCLAIASAPAAFLCAQLDLVIRGGSRPWIIAQVACALGAAASEGPRGRAGGWLVAEGWLVGRGTAFDGKAAPRPLAAWRGASPASSAAPIDAPCTHCLRHGDPMHSQK
jgi:hypothetical protein